MNKKIYILLIICLALADLYTDKINIIFYPKNRTYLHSQSFIKLKEQLKSDIKLTTEIEVNDDLAINSCECFKNANLDIKTIIQNKRLYEFYNKCALLNILNDSVIALNKKMTKNVKLTDFENWSSQLVLTETCENNPYAIHELQNKYVTVQDLIDDNLIQAKIKDNNSVIFENLYDNKKLYVKEITRCAFKNDDYQYLILEIKIHDLKSNKEECTIYRKYSQYSDIEGVLNRKF